jgi:hypothetical protein
VACKQLYKLQGWLMSACLGVAVAENAQEVWNNLAAYFSLYLVKRLHF